MAEDSTYILVAKPGSDETPMRCLNTPEGRAAAASGGRYPVQSTSRKTADGFVMVTKDGERLHRCLPSAVGYSGMRLATDRELQRHGFGKLVSKTEESGDAGAVRPKKLQQKGVEK